MQVSVRPYSARDVEDMRAIWNAVILSGDAFPQDEPLTQAEASAFFSSQSACGVAVDDADGAVMGMYILHPNNVGRCAHICNASFAVDPKARGAHVGRALVQDCLSRAAFLGFTVMQFNAVVAGNAAARHLYEGLGFVRLGTVPGGFRMDDGTYSDICLYYRRLDDLRAQDGE